MTVMRLGAMALLAALVCAVVGCEPSRSRDPGLPLLGQVKGVVTLDGVPETEFGLTVTFEPISGDRSSVSYTDENGEYELRFSRQLNGALIGRHTVRIVTRTPYQFGPPPNWREKISARYNTNSQLTVEVKEGLNIFNFDLTSD